jgi:dynactin complex subunit
MTQAEETKAASLEEEQNRRNSDGLVSRHMELADDQRTRAETMTPVRRTLHVSGAVNVESGEMTDREKEETSKMVMELWNTRMKEIEERYDGQIKEVIVELREIKAKLKRLGYRLEEPKVQEEVQEESDDELLERDDESDDADYSDACEE